MILPSSAEIGKVDPRIRAVARSMNVRAPAQNDNNGPRTTRHAGYIISQKIRKRIEEAGGCTKYRAGHGSAAAIGV